MFCIKAGNIKVADRAWTDRLNVGPNVYRLLATVTK
ncbi:uncharacterized protein METZ01_LOCUS53463 [marine metagenome]|uniref:Uncharacterized protein n=1 Tax=marine metagenome TaxID=408172 RepID=A0A381SAU3_9ZZZZ